MTNDSYKEEARKFMESNGVDPDVFDFDIPQLMADFARIKVGENCEEGPGPSWEWGA